MENNNLEGSITVYGEKITNILYVIASTSGKAQSKQKFMRKLILPPIVNSSTCVHRSQSIKLVLLSAQTCEENFNGRRRRIWNRCVISSKCILWLRSLCLDAHTHGSCSFAHRKHSVFFVALAFAHLLSHVMSADKMIVLWRKVLDMVWGMHCPTPASFPAKTHHSP